MKNRILFLGILGLVLLSGCGGAGDKDVNKDKDRPQRSQPAEKK